MRYLLWSFLIVTIFCSTCHAALNATTVWEVWSTGSVNNGGGFDSSQAGGTGVDYTQQASAQVTCSGTLSAAQNSTTLTTTGGLFTSNLLLGNLIHITAGTNFVSGWYCVVGYTDTNNIILDRAPATAGAGSGGTGRIGGALAAIAGPGTTAEVPGNIIYIKNTATYNITANQVFGAVTGATSTLPITVIGYNTTRGDGGQVTVKLTSGSSINMLYVSGNCWYFKNFIIDANAQTTSSCLDIQGYYLTFENCIFKNFTAYGINSTKYNNNYINCQVTGGSAGAIAAVYLTFGANVFIGLSVTGNACPPVLINAATEDSSQLFYRCIIANNTGAYPAIKTYNRTPLMIISSDIYNNNGDGVYFDSATLIDCLDGAMIWDTIIVNNTGYAVNVSGASVADVPSDYNAFYGNNSGGTQLNNWPSGSHDVTLTGDPFVAGASGNFALNATAGAGTSCEGAGFPGALQYGGTGSMDIGAFQHSH